MTSFILVCDIKICISVRSGENNRTVKNKIMLQLFIKKIESLPLTDFIPAPPHWDVYIYIVVFLKKVLYKKCHACAVLRLAFAVFWLFWATAWRRWVQHWASVVHQTWPWWDVKRTKRLHAGCLPCFRFHRSERDVADRKLAWAGLALKSWLVGC